MEKIKIDDYTFVKIFKPEDFNPAINGAKAFSLSDSFKSICTGILKAYETRNKDLALEISNTELKIDDFFNQDEQRLGFVSYSTIGCKPGQIKPKAFAFCSSQPDYPWNLELIYKKKNESSHYPKQLLEVIFDYTQKLGADKMTANVSDTNDASLSFFQRNIDENVIQGKAYKDMGVVQFDFDLKTFKPTFKIENLATPQATIAQAQIQSNKDLLLKQNQQV